MGRITLISLTFNFYLREDFKFNPFRNVSILLSLDFIRADRIPFYSLVKVSPSKNHSG